MNFIMNFMNFMNFLSQEKKYIGFEDVKYAIQFMKTNKTNSNKYILINTLPLTEQICIIQNTVHASEEESIINEYVLKDEDTEIIIYGRNSTDISVYKKYDQLQKLGFTVYLYSGGLFEWLLLQNIYGETEFPTNQSCKDILQYRPLPTYQHISF